jgi:hypothetical protein
MKRAVSVSRLAELVECSLVAVGANPNALQVAKSLSLSSETRSLILAEPGNLDEISRRGLVGGRARITQRNVKMTLAERIQAAQQRLIAAKDRLTEHINKSVDGEDPTDEFTTAQEELTNSVNAAQKALDTLKNAEKALGTTAQDPDEVQSPSYSSRHRQSRAVQCKAKEARSQRLYVSVFGGWSSGAYRKEASRSGDARALRRR